MSRSFPNTPTDLTDSWLTDTLRANGAIREARVTAHELQPIGEGVGMMALLSRIVLTYDKAEAGAPASLIGKFPTQVEQNRAVADHFRVYEREALFLRDVAPQTTASVPAVYGVDIELPSGEFVLLMEDLGAYRTGDQVEGCGPDEAKTVLDALVPVHAAFWASVDRPELSFAPRIDGEMQRVGMSGMCASGWDVFIERFGQHVPAVIQEARERYTGAAEELHYRMGRVPQTLVHGDLRLDNIMFGTEPGHRSAVVLDWQGVIVSAAVQDVAYLLTQNLTIENRRAHEDALLHYYHGRLVELGVADYPFDRFAADYRLAALYLFVYAVVIGGTLDPSNERGMAFMAQLIDRACSAIVDHDLLALL
jgi:aminoglycoside/choline kinase family phosphotransferase